MKSQTANALTAFLAMGTCLHAADVKPAAPAAPSPDVWGITLPPSITEASLSTKLGFDTNVYGTDVSLVGKPDIANQESAVLTISPKVLVNGVKLFSVSKDSSVKTFSFGYAGDYAFYDQFSKEDNARHSLPVSLKMKQGDWSFGLDNTFLYVNGSKSTPMYKSYSAYGIGLPRERREQFQDRLATNLRWDQESYFLRATGSALTYDLRTNHHYAEDDPTYLGYLNFVDRHDVNTGLDFGYKSNKDLSWVAGWRVGQQHQNRHDGGKVSKAQSSSTYNRFQFGFEGKLCSWLQGSLVAGPDYRRYSADGGALGIKGNSHTWIYGEGSLTALVSDSDTLVLTGKVWHWVSSTGVTSYEDNAYALTWKHSFSKQFSTSLGAKLSAAQYDAPSVRNDQLYSVPVGLSYSFSKEIVLSADYQWSKADNRTVNPSSREFEQNLFSVTLKLAL